MAFAIYLHRETFQPESPIILDKNITAESNVNFTFVDFVPSIIKRSGTVIPQCEVQYHSFSIMIDTANEWLQRNSDWEVVNCETVILLYKYNDQQNQNELRPNDCCFYIYGSEKNNVLKALRCWVKRRESVAKNGINECQALSYIDLIPENKDGSDYSGKTFEKLDEVIARLNATIRSGGLEGKIITIESLSYDATNDWKIDPEVSLSSMSSKNMFILRVFYEIGLPSTQEIGIQDFLPQMISRGTFFKRPRFETFDKVIERGFQWLRQNPQINFRNAQSIDVKMKSLSQVNTNLMAFTEHGDYCRIFRMTYTKPIQQQKQQTSAQVDDEAGAAGAAQQPTYLSTKIFLPYKKCDTITDIKQRLSDWVNQYLDKSQTQNNGSGTDSPGVSHRSDGANGGTSRWPRVLSAETVEVFAKDFRDDNIVELEKAANDDTFLANRFGNKNAYMFFSLRVFYDSGGPGAAPTGSDSPSNSDNSISAIDSPADDHN